MSATAIRVQGRRLGFRDARRSHRRVGDPTLCGDATPTGPSSHFIGIAADPEIE